MLPMILFIYIVYIYYIFIITIGKNEVSKLSIKIRYLYQKKAVCYVICNVLVNRLSGLLKFLV